MACVSTCEVLGGALTELIQRRVLDHTTTAGGAVLKDSGDLHERGREWLIDPECQSAGVPENGDTDQSPGSQACSLSLLYEGI